MLERLIPVFEKSGDLLLELLPYILFGVLLAEILKYTPWTNLVREYISRTLVLSVILSSLLGIISPLCTYGTIPIIINLHKGGVPLAPLLTFLSASSLMNPQLFVITWGGLGAEIATIRIISVLVFTLTLGFVIAFLDKKYLKNSGQVVNKKFTRTTSTEKNIKSFKFKDFAKSFYHNLEFVGFYIVTGIVISMLLETFVPLESILNRTNRVEWVNVIAASLLGIPLYACGGGTIPLVDTLIESGMSMGAAMAFLIVGPGTRITPLLALGSFLSRKMLFFYVVSLLFFAIVSGIFINVLFGTG